MNLLKAFTAGARNLPAISATTNALTARLTGINRWGMSGFLSLETAPAENEKLFRDGYTENHITFIVGDWKAQQFAKAPPIVYEVKDKKHYAKYKLLSPLQKADSYALRTKSIEEIDDKEDRMVKTLLQPNPSQTWAELAYAISVYYDFSGNALIYGVGPDAGANAGQFHELYILPTGIYAGMEPTVEGYTYFQDSTGVNPKISGTQVLHLRRFNARTEAEGGGLWGMSKLAPARRVIAKSTQAQEAEAELFLNRGARVIVFPKNLNQSDPPPPGWAAQAGDEMRKKLKQAGSGGIATNSVELGVIQLGMSSDDLKLIESNALTEKQVCALWHLDSTAIFSDVTEASRANAETGVRKSLIEGVLPDQSLLAQKLNKFFVEPYNRSAKYQRYMEFNTDVYPQLQTDKTEQMGWLKELVLSPNQKNEFYGIERSDYPGMDIPLVPPGYTPITDLTNPPEADPNKDPQNDGTY